MQRDRAQGQRAVGVVDDGDLAGPAERERGGRLVEQQPVGGVDGDQLRRLDVGRPAELREELGGHVSIIGRCPGRVPREPASA